MRNLSKSSIRLFLTATLSVLVGGISAWAYKNYSEPVAGGPNGDGYFATLRKQQIYKQFADQVDGKGVPLTSHNVNSWYSIYQEPVQSLELYQSQKPTSATQERKTIVLQPLGEFNSQQIAMIEYLRVYCELFFQLPARINKPISLKALEKSSRASSFFKGQRQYDAGKILFEVLEPQLPADAALVLGVTMADIYSSNLSFVFGLGSWSDRVGVYSLARYFPKEGGKLSPQDKAKVLRRSCQVLNHEAGHMFGITHCTMYKCSMNGSNSLTDSDQTPLEFCPVCRKKIEWNLKLDMKKRDAALDQFYAKHELTPFIKTLKND
jgi:archaemetzincin